LHKPYWRLGDATDGVIQQHVAEPCPSEGQVPAHPANQGCVRGWWLDQGLGKALLILSPQAEEDLLLNGSLGRVLGCTEDEIREAAPLQLSRPLQGGINSCR
jgi:hypothetical protein